jgi:hypothetical protein
MKIGWGAIILLTALAYRGPATAQAKHTYSSEQVHFSAEDEGVQKPVPIPEDVLAILNQDELVRNVLKNEGIPADKLPLSWFSASFIHLSSLGEPDLVVLGEGDLRGANVVTFWVFCSTPHGHELVLMAHEHDLEVKKARWKGHREIEISGETAIQFSSVLLRWDGDKYAAYREKSEPIK